MSDTERLVKFELLGQEHEFYTAVSEEEMRAILSLVRQIVATDSDNGPGAFPVSKVAVMGCLNIASRYVQLQQEFEEYKRDSEERMIWLSERIRARLLAK